MLQLLFLSVLWDYIFGTKSQYPFLLYCKFLVDNEFLNAKMSPYEVFRVFRLCVKNVFDCEIVIRKKNSKSQTPEILEVPFLREHIFFLKKKDKKQNFCPLYSPSLCFSLVYAPLSPIYVEKRVPVYFPWVYWFSLKRNFSQHQCLPYEYFERYGGANSLLVPFLLSNENRC